MAEDGTKSVDPDRHFYNFEPPKSVHRRTLFSSRNSIGRFWGLKIVKGSLGIDELKVVQTHRSKVFWGPETAKCGLISLRELLWSKKLMYKSAEHTGWNKERKTEVGSSRQKSFSRQKMTLFTKFDKFPSSCDVFSGKLCGSICLMIMLKRLH